MRCYIFTEKERQIIDAFLEDGTKLEGYAQLNSRIRKHWLELTDDFTRTLEWASVFHDEFKTFTDECEKFKALLQSKYPEAFDVEEPN